MADAAVEDERDEIWNKFIQAVINDRIVGAAHFQKVLVVGATIEVR